MADTRKIFDKVISEIAEVVKLINEKGEDVDSKVISDKNDDISDLHAILLDEKNDFVALTDLKDYIKKIVGKNYFTDKRCWDYLYDSVFEVFMDIPNEFDEPMQTGLGMENQLPTNSVYDGELDDLYSGVNKNIKKLINGLSVDDACDIALESNFDIDGKEHDENIDKINALSDAWELYNKSWEKFNDTYTIGDIEEMYNEIKHLFGKKGSKVIEGWIEDINDVFYSNEDVTSLDLNFGFKGNDMFESKEKIMDKRLTEKKVDEEDRIEALAQFLGLDEEEKEEIEANDDILTYYDKEYYVLTDDEADEKFEQYQRDLWDDMGIQSFNDNFRDWIIRNAVDTDWFEQAMDESNRFYCEDIVGESSKEFDNRLVEECYERGLIDDDDFEENEDGDVDHELCKKDNDDLIELMVESMNDDWDDPVEWYIDNFGEKDLSDCVIEHNLVDLDKVIEELKSLDGRGNTLSSYDGEENSEKVNGEWFYIYRTN